MALPRAFTTLRELAYQQVPGDREVLDRIIEVVDQVYPQTWPDWNVVNYEKKDLFGSKIDPQVLNKLRFAIPTVSIVKAFDLETTSVSEKTFKNMKLSLLDWPFCRALIISPKSLALKIRGSASNLEIFMAKIRNIRDSFVSREEAECLISGKERIKRPSSQFSLHGSQNKKQKTNDSAEELKVLKHMMAQILANQSNQNPSEHRCLRDFDSESAEDISSKDEDQESDHPAPSVIKAPVIELDLPDCTDDLFVFSPSVKEAEPKVMPAPADLLQQAMTYQRFDQPSWANIRYSEVNKRLQATPAFTSLSINPQLAGKTPNWVPYEQVIKFDQTLGAVTHGLLSHWKQLRESLSKVAREVKSKALKEAIEKHVTGPESDFKKSSDDILQFVCGRRAELIEFRRSVYKPASKFMHNILHAIPPSSTHLFEENALSETFKQNGGFYKFFPSSRGSTDGNMKRQEYRESSSFQGGKQQGQQHFKKRKPTNQPSSSTSTSAGRNFRKPFESGAPSGRMSRLSPSNPVRRQLFAEDADEARVDNFANFLQESIVADREQKKQKWNFDFENEVPLEGVYEWYRSDGHNDWIGVKCDTKLEDTEPTEQDSFLPMKIENEITPKTKEEELAPLLRKRRKDAESGDDKARRKITFD